MGAFLYYKTKFFELKEQREVKRQFYSNTRFSTLDQRLIKAVPNPYQISKAYQIQRNQNPYTYGETPLTTMAQIVRECNLTSQDTVIELGAGRGRAALFLGEYIGCQVIGYEQIPYFVEQFRVLGSSHVQMRAEDFFQADFGFASAIYLYGTLLDKKEILQLIQHFPKKTKIMTVSYALSEYSQSYKTIKTFSGRFPWGITGIHWNERIV